MNQTKIDWADFTWNPVTGCKHACYYCYGQDMADRFNKGNFEPVYHPDRIHEPMKRKKPARIFVGSMTDLGGNWVQPDWIRNILSVVDECQQHTFIFLSKKPWNLIRWFDKPRKNVWLGCTVESSEHTSRIDELRDINTVPVRFVSFEPLLEQINANLSGIDWIIIGPRTNPLILPDKEWVTSLTEQAKKRNIAVFYKEKLQRLDDLTIFQELPGVVT